MNKVELENRFIYHAPKPEQVKQYENIREFANQYAIYLNDVVPESREKSLSITHLEEVVFWANAAIARNS